MKKVKIIILAAGKGVRMQSDTPKVLHPVCGKPLIRHVLDVVRSLGAAAAYVVVGHGSAAVKRVVGKDGVIVVQKQLRGTADAVKTVQGYFRGYRGDVLIVSGDAPLITAATVKTLVRKHKKTKAACTLLTARLATPAGYGRIIRDSRKRVVAIGEHADLTGQEKDINEINAGMYCFKSDVLFKALRSVAMNKKKKEFYLTDAVALLSGAGARIETVIAHDSNEASGINTRADLAAAQVALNRRNLDSLMAQGVTIIDPTATYIDSGVIIGRDTVIKPYTVIETNVRIGSHCVIGPFAHVRCDTKIGNNVEVGNFTEVSRAMVGEGCFIKHFSFVGDAILGRRVNIGAGVVTANFDGKHKHKTVISDDSFIGSDSVLIAPLTLGKKVVTGAGCVVTAGKKIPDGTVLAGVPAKALSRRKNT